MTEITESDDKREVTFRIRFDDNKEQLAWFSSPKTVWVSKDETAAQEALMMLALKVDVYVKQTMGEHVDTKLEILEEEDERHADDSGSSDASG